MSRVSVLLLVSAFISVVMADPMTDAYREAQQLAHGSKPPVLNESMLKAVPGYEAGMNNPQVTDDIGALEQQAKGTSEYQRWLSQFEQDEKIIAHTEIPGATPDDLDVDPTPFCQHGHCEVPAEPVVDNFGESLSSLQAVDDAVAGLHKEGILRWQHYAIFSGKSYECRDVVTGYNNCCKDKGWGQSAGLAGCNSEEKELGQKKEKGQCHKIGKMCAHKIKTPAGSVCTEYKQIYCCFSSKLSRIVMEGVREQLHEGWGESKAPNCQGVPVYDSENDNTNRALDRVDFSRIDFSEAISDMSDGLAFGSEEVLRAHLNEVIQP